MEKHPLYREDPQKSWISTAEGHLEKFYKKPSFEAKYKEISGGASSLCSTVF